MNTIATTKPTTPHVVRVVFYHVAKDPLFLDLFYVEDYWEECEFKTLKEAEKYAKDYNDAPKGEVVEVYVDGLLAKELNTYPEGSFMDYACQEC